MGLSKLTKSKSFHTLKLLAFATLFIVPLNTKINATENADINSAISTELLLNDLNLDNTIVPITKLANKESSCIVSLEKTPEKSVIIEQKNELELFKQDLKKYKPNAPWITESFMDMDLKDFSYAFKHIIKILTVPQKQWFYFTDNPNNFNPDNYWTECLWQCMHYEQWMAQLSIDEKSLLDQTKLGKWKDKNNLMYKSIEHPKVSFSRILDTIEKYDLGKNMINKYYQFYAFYTDCLSHFFCKAVYACYSSMDDVNLYKLFLNAAKKSLSRMKQNLIILKKSKFFYPTYKITADSYKKILALLEAEKVKAKL